MNLRKFGLKLFTQTPTPAAPADLYTPIFHRWIQGQSLEGVLIDVADYSHVYCGPGILLVTHAGNYAMDDANGRHGMSYTRRADPEAGALTDALVADCERLLHACALLEGDSECRGLVTFAANQIEVFSNDRLVAPNSDSAWKDLVPDLEELAGRLYGDGAATLERVGESRDRLCGRIVSNETAVAAVDLLKRLKLG